MDCNNNKKVFFWFITTMQSFLLFLPVKSEKRESKLGSKDFTVHQLLLIHARLPVVDRSLLSEDPGSCSYSLCTPEPQILLGPGSQ